ncbi:MULTISPECIES: hypothetical protein [Pseudomonas]|uniref:hypothetical protein n=1 Tax=Pseudomonas TaxID=286 RepID=UPI001B335016|nr:MULTISPECIES: hypothetical protein [Pseudomonas]MBP5948381.1 hypothetical protein [Pseudomonas sp. P9(2020)]MBP5958667.1 hypothetical protein [Pseudomonas anatoliensis]MBZ9560536.1 hypothetical protein [Pseudomonas sp. P116]
MNTRQITLANGWTATFENNGEFHMGAEGWSLLLQGPDNRMIQYFADQIVLVNDEDGTQANSCIRLSSDGVYGYLSTAVDNCWVIDFARGMIAPHRVSIRHHHDAYDESVALFEQPAFKRARQYISVVGRYIYLTFPLTRDEDFPKVWDEYLSIRRRQLDELYFRN